MIKATIILDSISPEGIRITTFELEYPRFIHSELMTHRCFSRNAASSRAIPIEAMHKQILEETAMPVSWGKNMAGMQAKEDLPPEHTEIAKQLWAKACKDALHWSKALADLGLHKQCANRIVESFVTMKTIVTSTEWANWYELRNHSDADPTIHALAAAMEVEHIKSVPVALAEGQWHLPYVDSLFDEAGHQWLKQDDVILDLETAKMISVSCCAQVSYRKSDTSIDKAKMIYERLVGMRPQHASPLEHQATPLESIPSFTTWPKGVTHMDRAGQFWSNNFRGWLQNRSLM